MPKVEVELGDKELAILSKHRAKAIADFKKFGVLPYTKPDFKKWEPVGLEVDYSNFGSTYHFKVNADDVEYTIVTFEGLPHEVLQSKYKGVDGLDVEVEYDDTIVPEHDEDSHSETEVEEVDYTIEVDGWESWGGDVQVPAKGWFEQDGNKTNMTFTHFTRTENGGLSGKGSDDIGQFEITGSFSGGGFKFVKQYVGAHAVNYNGTYKAGVMTGKWEIPGNCSGKFNLMVGWQRWTGQFFQDGTGNKMELDYMYVGDSGVIGGGKDVVGEFKVNGKKDGNTITFAKHYIGAHTVYYMGGLEGRKITGKWTIPDNCEGKFKLKCKRDLW